MIQKNKIKRYITKFIGAFFSSASLPVSIILTTPLLLNKFGIESVANYNLIFLALNVVMVFFQGLFTTIVKEISSKTEGGTLRFKIIERILLPAITVLSVAFLFIPNQTNLIVTLWLLLTSFYSNALVGLGAQFIQGLIFGCIHLFFAVSVYLFFDIITKNSHINIIYIIITISGAVILRATIYYKFKESSTSFKKRVIKWDETKKLSLSEGLGIITSFTDRLSVYLLLPTSVFGIYSIANTMGKAASLLRTPLLRVFVPDLLNNKGDLAYKTILTSFIICATIMPTLTFLSINCAWIFQIWIGPQLKETIITTQLLLIGSAFHTSATPLYYSLVGLNKASELIKLNTSLLLASIFCFSISASYSGIVAVALLWVFFNAMNFVICYGVLAKSLHNNKSLKIAFIPILLMTILPALPLLFSFNWKPA